MDAVRGCGDRDVAGDGDRVELQTLGRCFAAENAGDGRVQAEGFFDEAVEVRQVVDAVDADGGAIVDVVGVELGAELLAQRGVDGHVVGQEGEGRGGGVAAGDDQETSVAGQEFRILLWVGEERVAVEKVGGDVVFCRGLELSIFDGLLAEFDQALHRIEGVGDLGEEVEQPWHRAQQSNGFVRFSYDLQSPML